jgi:pimeloyl-ACP methyl ester carboxylesterase
MYPQRTRTLVVASAPVAPPAFSSTSERTLDKKWVTDTQRDRLGSAASREEVEYWSNMMSGASPEAQNGIEKVTAALQMESVLPHIAARTLVITADRSALQSVEAILRYRKRIPNSRLVVLLGDAYHVAVAKADECVTNVLAFIKEAGQQA